MSEIISVIISGNKEGNAGFMPLVIVGNPQFSNGDYSYRNGFENSKYYYEIENTNNYILYTFIANPNSVASYGASRNGRLRIGVSIPRGYRIAGDISPYEVLNRIKDNFFGLNMTSSGMNTVYNFKKELDSNEPYDAICTEYQLEKDNGRYVVMAGNESACVLTGKELISQFFKDTQYTEFANYKSIIVAEAGTPLDINILKIDIPRKDSYKIYVNGFFNKQIITSVDEDVLVKCIPCKYEYVEPLYISLSKIRKGECQGVTIDEVQETVKCTITPHNKIFERNIIFVTDEDSSIIDSELDSFRLSYNGRTKKILEGNKFQFEGEEVSFLWKCEYAGNKGYTVKLEHDIEACNGTDTIEVKKQVEIKPRQTETTTQKQTKKPVCNNGKENKPFGIIIELKSYKKDFDSSLDIRIYSDKYVFCDHIELKDKQEKKANTVHSAFLPLSEYWQTCYIKEIVFSSDNYEYGIYFLARNFSDGEIISIEGFCTKNFCSKFSKILEKKIFLAIISLLVGIVLGITSSIYFELENIFFGKDITEQQDSGQKTIDANNELKTQEIEVVDEKTQGKSEPNILDSDESQNVKKSGGVDTATATVDSNVQQECNEYLKKLKKADLTFDEVNVINQWVEDHKNDAQKPLKFDDILKMVPFFVKAVFIVQNYKSYEDVNAYIAAMRELNNSAQGGDLKPFRELIQAAYLIRNGENIKRIEKILYEDHLNEIQSFPELKKLKEVKL